jgi:hypothetical protein
MALAVDSAGSVIIGEYNNFYVRKMTPINASVTTMFGTGVTGASDSPIVFANIAGIAVDSADNLYVASGSIIQKIVNGVATTIPTYVADHPRRIRMDSSDNLYVASYTTGRIKVIEPDNTVTIYQASTSAYGIAVSPDGTRVALSRVYLDCVERFTTTAALAAAPAAPTLPATAESYGSCGATGALVDSTDPVIARFDQPSGIAVDDVTESVLLVDSGNHVVRRAMLTGAVSTFAGDGTAAVVDNTGLLASFNAPVGIVRDNTGSVYYTTEGTGNVVRSATSAAVVAALAGDLTTAGLVDGVGAAAQFSSPLALAYYAHPAAAASLFVCDAANHAVRRVFVGNGSTSTFAGRATSGLSQSTLQFNAPQGIAVTDGGAIFVSDLNLVVHKISASTGLATAIYNGFAAPQQMSVGITSEYVYVADSSLGVLLLAPNGAVTTLVSATNVVGVSVDSKLHAVYYSRKASNCVEGLIVPTATKTSTESTTDSAAATASPSATPSSSASASLQPSATSSIGDTSSASATETQRATASQSMGVSASAAVPVSASVPPTASVQLPPTATASWSREKEPTMTTVAPTTAVPASATTAAPSGVANADADVNSGVSDAGGAATTECGAAMPCYLFALVLLTSLVLVVGVVATAVHRRLAKRRAAEQPAADLECVKVGTDESAAVPPAQEQVSAGLPTARETADVPSEAGDGASGDLESV